MKTKENSKIHAVEQKQKLDKLASSTLFVAQIQDTRYKTVELHETNLKLEQPTLDIQSKSNEIVSNFFFIFMRGENEEIAKCAFYSFIKKNTAAVQSRKQTELNANISETHVAAYIAYTQCGKKILRIRKWIKHRTYSHIFGKMPC